MDIETMNSNTTEQEAQKNIIPKEKFGLICKSG
jgi:hypothetical protein